MTVKELRDFLSQFPDDMVVVFQAFEEDSFNFINGGFVKKDTLYDGTEIGNKMLWLFEI